MKAKLIETSDKELVLQVTVTLESGMLKTEESIQDSLNQAGCLATEIALSRFDTNGEPIMVNGLRYTTKGQIEKIYQTPYGEVKLPRHVYQGSRGGKTYCPLDRDARTIVYSTPKFAKSVSSKYASASSRTVHDDLKGNHGRYISRTYIKDIADAVGGIALDKEEKWSQAPPVSFGRVETIGFGLDGTCMFMSEDGWRQAMVGTIAYFDSEGERLNTIYLSAAPEYGKSRFLKKFEDEVARAKRNHPDSKFVGIADGARDNWKFLSKHTEVGILDFYHACEYVTKVADVAFRSKNKRAKWPAESRHRLKHDPRGAAELMREFGVFRDKCLSGQKREKIESSITYFANNIDKMKYHEYRAMNFPIGSGVTESACKVIVKQRMCNSGMKWKKQGAESVLCLRALNYSSGRWGQMWDKINRYGI